MPIGISASVLARFFITLDELDYDIMIENNNSGSPGWTATLEADFLSIIQTYTTDATAFNGFTTVMQDTISQTTTFFAQQRYNGETVTGVTEDTGIYTGTPVYHGPFSSLMGYINQGWVSGGSSAPIAMPSYSTAMDETVTFLQALAPGPRATALALLKLNYPTLYADILTRYIESL